MGETVWKSLIDDLRAEDHASEAKDLEAIMKQRAQVWSGQQDPFGSEQAWDSTGQEGVYLWSKHFGYEDTANKTLNSIRGYMPTVAHWGWNGNARRYWDFTYVTTTSFDMGAANLAELPGRSVESSDKSTTTVLV